MCFFSNERQWQGVLPPGKHIFWPFSPFFVSTPVSLHTHYVSSQKYMLVHSLSLQNSAQYSVLVVTVCQCRECIICQHKSRLIFPFVVRAFQTLSIYNGPCNEISLLGNWTSSLQTSRKLFKCGRKKSDSGIETNDDINVNVYFLSVKTINLINKHVLGWHTEFKIMTIIKKAFNWFQINDINLIGFKPIISELNTLKELTS